MHHALRAAWLAIALLLAACGGGAETAQAERAPAAAAPHASVALPMAPDASTLMNWAEAQYPAYFPGSKANGLLSPYLYRYYPETGNYLAVAGEEVFVYGPVSGGRLLSVGRLSDFACQVTPAGCLAGDARSGTYTAYAASGERFIIAVDFDTAQYAITGITVPSYQALGGIGADASAGTYLFTGPSIPANAKFRYVDDLLVGAFDTGSGLQPFVAARYFAQSLAEAAGTYNIFGVNRTAAGAGDSFIYQGRLAADATLRLCGDNTVYTIDQCPAASVNTWTVTQSGDQFTATPDAANTGSSSFYFRVAKAGGNNIYLWTSVGSVTGTRYFRIGLQESSFFPASVTHGANTSGAWTAQTLATSSYASSGTALDGQSFALDGSLSSFNGPAGFRTMYGVGFAMRNDQLTAVVGGRGGAYAGFLQLGAR